MREVAAKLENQQHALAENNRKLKEVETARHAADAAYAELKAAEDAVRAAEEELAAAVAELKRQEEEFAAKKKMLEAKKEDESLGVVARNKVRLFFFFFCPLFSLRMKTKLFFSNRFIFSFS